MIYAYTDQQPKQDWCMQTEKDYLVNFRKNYEKFGSTACFLWLQFHAVTRCDMVSYFFNVSKRKLF